MATLIIEKVDFKLLERQRRMLGELATRAELAMEGMSCEFVLIDRGELGALVGLVNMLDAWYDTKGEC